MKSKQATGVPIIAFAAKNHGAAIIATSACAEELRLGAFFL